MNDKPHILIVDDDLDIRQLLAQYLGEHGFVTVTAKNGIEMQRLLHKEKIDLIVLDIMMPGEDGLTICRRLRSESTIPIIMLTAVDNETDKVVGLEIGADDYITKPFNPRELLARIKAVMRRYGISTESDTQPANIDVKEYTFNDWVLNTIARQLFSPDGVEISLSSGEYELLLIFMHHPQRVLSRDELLDLTKNRAAGPFDRSIDMQISRLRQKLEEDPKQPKIIKTIRNGGYILTAVVEYK
ncbi:MAG: response regulator [Gammaproteobacteria bacterium]|nr:response regulator [Gammaproteobacteria bacterium]